MDTVTLIGRLLVSLAAVLGVVWVIGRRMRKTGRGRSSGLIEVLDRRQLSRNSSVAVVRVGEQALVIGVTDNQVSVLGETDAHQAISLSEAVRPAARAPRTARTAKTAKTAKTQKASARAAASRHRSAATQRPARTVTARPTPAADVAATDAEVTELDTPQATTAPSRSPLAGSALSPQTWKQTIESLREMTAR